MDAGASAHYFLHRTMAYDPEDIELDAPLAIIEEDAEPENEEPDQDDASETVEIAGLPGGFCLNAVWERATPDARVAAIRCAEQFLRLLLAAPGQAKKGCPAHPGDERRSRSENCEDSDNVEYTTDSIYR
ncbi:MAG: hypothetical protein KGL39_26770 [Patescibacteria group bacterium]|nr:hypothetical protein [Patescibacteria group bacterium]